MELDLQFAELLGFAKEETKVVKEVETKAPIEKTPYEKQMELVAELTRKVEVEMNGRKETEIGLESPYWALRTKLNHAHTRAEELRPK